MNLSLLCRGNALCQVHPDSACRERAMELLMQQIMQAIKKYKDNIMRIKKYMQVTKIYERIGGGPNLPFLKVLVECPSTPITLISAYLTLVSTQERQTTCI